MRWNTCTTTHETNNVAPLALATTLNTNSHVESVVRQASRPGVMAIVFIALNVHATKELHVSFLLSALANTRTLGQWEGEIVVITDHVSSLNASITAHMKDALGTFRIVDAADLFSRAQISREQLESLKLSLRVKTLKTLLLNSTDADTILYLDADVLIMRSMDPFLTFLHQGGFLPQLVISDNRKFGNSSSTLKQPILATFPEPTVRSELLHTGIMVVPRRSETDLLMEAWRHQILSGQFRRDQQALTRVLRTNPQLLQQIFPIPLDFWAILRRPPVPELAVFNHLTCLGECRKYDPDFTPKNRLQICCVLVHHQLDMVKHGFTMTLQFSSTNKTLPDWDSLHRASANTHKLLIQRATPQPSA